MLAIEPSSRSPTTAPARHSLPPARGPRAALAASAVLAWLAAPATGQVRVNATYHADTAMRVFAGAASNTVPRGTDLTGGLHLRVAEPTGTGGAVHQVNFSHSPLTGTTLTQHDNTNMETLGLAAGTGPHETLLRLTPSQPVAVTAEISLFYAAFATHTPQHVRARGRIDVGDDGSFEIDATLGQRVETTFLRTIPPGGLAVRTITQSTAQQPGQPLRVFHHGTLQIRVRPVSSCTVEGGPGGFCIALSPLLFGSMTFAHSVLLQTQGTQRNSPVLTVFGTALTRFTIPGTPCEFNVTPEVFVIGSTGPRGLAFLEVPVPRGVALTVHAQQVVPGFPGQFPLLPTPVVTIRCP